MRDNFEKVKILKYVNKLAASMWCVNTCVRDINRVEISNKIAMTIN